MLSAGAYVPDPNLGSRIEQAMCDGLNQVVSGRTAKEDAKGPSAASVHTDKESEQCSSSVSSAHTDKESEQGSSSVSSAHTAKESDKALVQAKRAFKALALQTSPPQASTPKRVPRVAKISGEIFMMKTPPKKTQKV